MSSFDPSVLLAVLPFSLWQWLLVELAIVLVYVVFGIAGFGTAPVAGPLLTGVLPLPRIAPLLVPLDFSAPPGNWLPTRRRIAITELKRLLPCMLLGCALGVYGLLALCVELLMLALGVFVSFYVLYALFLQPRGRLRWRATWALPFGVFGGLFDTLFSSGGLPYSLCLNGRLASREQMCATQSAPIGCSTFVRLGLFPPVGLYVARELWLFVACLLPDMALGLWIGRRVILRLSREAFVRLVTWPVLYNGLTLVGCYLAV